MTVSQRSDTRIEPEDARYLTILNRRFNKRFCARPDYIMAVSSTDQIVSAVQQAVTEGRRLIVTSRGHCRKGFVSDPEVRVNIDVSPMKCEHGSLFLFSVRNFSPFSVAWAVSLRS